MPHITDNDGVVYRPLEQIMLEGDGQKGRVVLLGEAVRATTPLVGQDARMAIKDALVLADEIGRHDDVEVAAGGYRDPRYARCRYIDDLSLSVCHG